MTARRSSRLTQKPRVDYNAMVKYGRAIDNKSVKANAEVLQVNANTNPKPMRLRCDPVFLMNFAFMTLIAMSLYDDRVGTQVWNPLNQWISSRW